MSVISIVGAAYRPIEKGYQPWLDSLKDREKVVLQMFQPPTSFLGWPFETWRYEQGRILKGKDGMWFIPEYGSEPSPPLLTDGSAVYNLDSKTEWGEVFPARVVPWTVYLTFKGRQSHIWGDRPIYEPFFQRQTRSVLFIPYGPDVYKRRSAATRNRRYYKLEVDGGYLVHIFAEDALSEESGFLYSKYIDLP
jgi:hypothetical protein